MEFTDEEKLKRIRDLRPIDDVFFEVLASNKDVCEEILRTILEDPKLIVRDVTPQKNIRNLYGRSVRLDALCTLGDGTLCNIEVQRADSDDHLRRVRYNASSITVHGTEPGADFKDVREVIVVYISEFDLFKLDKTIYHIDKVISETGTIINDGLKEVFVNTAVDDGTTISDLMSCFTRKEVVNPRFPKLSEEVRKLKSPGGESSMSQYMEQWRKEIKAAGAEERGSEIMLNMVKNGVDDAVIMKCTGCTAEDIAAIRKSQVSHG